MSLRKRVSARCVLILGFLATACGLVSDSGADSTLAAAFYGYAPSLSQANVELRAQVNVNGRSFVWDGDPLATRDRRQNFDPIPPLQAGDSISAVAILRTVQGVELARATTGLRVMARWHYGFGFQAGGRNPDTGSVCHGETERVAIPGFPGDTLFLWKSGLPMGAIC